MPLRTEIESNNEPKINLGIADDHPIYRAGIIQKLTDGTSINITFEAIDGLDLMAKLKTNPISLLLLDNMMPNMSGLEAMDLIKVCYPELKVILISATDHYFKEEYLDDFGIDDAILKSADKTELLELIYKVYKAPKCKQKLLKSEFTSKATIRKDEISKKEKEVINLLRQNKTDIEIAAQLKITKRTVETHRTNILKKTRSNNLIAAFQKIFWWLG